MLARTLFWFFGHPLVYFWLLPAYVMFYVMLPSYRRRQAVLRRRRAPGVHAVHRALVRRSASTTSSPIPGIASGYKWLHGALTFMVALPSFMTAFTARRVARVRGAPPRRRADSSGGGARCRTSIRALPVRVLLRRPGAVLLRRHHRHHQRVGVHEQRGAQHLMDSRRTSTPPWADRCS